MRFPTSTSYIFDTLLSCTFLISRSTLAFLNTVGGTFFSFEPTFTITGRHLVFFTMSTPNNDLLTDDYVAELLAKEAQDCSLKFSSMGMEAYKSTKK